MRLRYKDLKTVYLKKRSVIRDEEGEKITVYGPNAIPLEMNVQSAGGLVAAQLYGEQLPYMKHCKYQGDQLISGQNEEDGICLYVDQSEEPDYTIKSIQPFRTHLNVTLKKRV